MTIRKAKAALIWITDILNGLNVPFQIAGGLAANAYGATRDLWDIDIDIPEDKFEIVKEKVSEFIIFGPSRIKEKPWDLFLMTLNYKGQEIDLSGAYSVKIFDQSTDDWRTFPADLSKAIPIEILNVEIPFIPKKDLLGYKKILARHVDLADIEEIESQTEGEKYDLIVTQFDNDRDKSGREEQYIDILVKDLLPDAHILDVGCGMAEPIAKYLTEKGFKVTGIDASMKMLDLAKLRFPSMQWLCGDMRYITLTEKYDGVIAYDSFFHLTINDQIKMIKRFAGWLKPNGKLLVSTGPDESDVIDAIMHGYPFSYYSMSPENYTKYFNLNRLAVLYSEEDQPKHRIWIMKYEP